MTHDDLFCPYKGKADKWDNEMLTPKMFDILVHGADITDIPWTERGELDVQRLLDSYKKAEQLEAQVKELKEKNQTGFVMNAKDPTGKFYELERELQKYKDENKELKEKNKLLLKEREEILGFDEP